jgi:Putative MetA-pathway of phenol degradation
MKPFARISVFLLVLSGFCLRPAAARAQTSTSSGLSDLLPHLLTSGVTLAPPDVPGVVSHVAHFQPASNDPIFALTGQFNNALVASLASFPLGSSSGGFVFEGDPALGDFRPASKSFGPTFAERALTSGKGNFNFGVTFQAASFDSFEGKPLDDGSIKFFIRHTDCCGTMGDGPDPFFEADLVREDLTLKLKTNTTALLLNYGLSDRWDIGAAVPIVHVSIDASALATIDRVATASIPSLHHFPGPDPDHETITASGDATGLGDIVVRTKYRLVKAQGGGLAAGLDLRLPSGDDKNLLGIGTTQAKLSLIASGETGPLALHGNLGYAFAGTSDVVGDIPKEFDYTFGADFVAGRATIAFDVIGHTLYSTARFADASVQYPVEGAPSVTRTAFESSAGNLTQVLGAAGVKVLIAPHLLLTGNVLFPMTDNGLKAKAIPVVGLEYVFPRH